MSLTATHANHLPQTGPTANVGFPPFPQTRCARRDCHSRRRQHRPCRIPRAARVYRRAGPHRAAGVPMPARPRAPGSDHPLRSGPIAPFGRPAFRRPDHARYQGQRRGSVRISARAVAQRLQVHLAMPPARTTGPCRPRALWPEAEWGFTPQDAAARRQMWF